MSGKTMVEALNRALEEEMERDEDVVLMGEDVGEDGGVFRVTDGLDDQFNEDWDDPSERLEHERVIDTPLDEAGIVGTALGMSLYGDRPVTEIQFSGFMLPAMNQLIGHVARYRNRTRGKYEPSMVVRAPYGGGIEAPEHHSESDETLYAHTPGLKVAVPSTPEDAYGMMKEAVRDDDPVVFLEPKKIYRSAREELPDPDEDYTVGLGEADVKKEGDDVTVVSWGATLQDTLEAVDELEDDDIYAEVVDLRSISPIDFETIEESYKKTGKLVVAHEAPQTCGVGAEISSRITEDDHDLLYLEAPIKRVTGYDTTMPLYENEDEYLPDSDDIAEAIREVDEYGFEG
ncbi:MAG: alpha-ketoacid dehydrogenase subunit beta [Candidatus Nanohaloarchaea archaeon]|nr:alpha-ketoacid dehydrogenase subunit beta [Candidatus Nanohaloarchaea archaeon]